MTEKYYTLGTHTSEQWIELHAELITDGNTYASVPTRKIAVEDDRLHSPTTGSYLLTFEEAYDLRSDERVKFINESPEKYPEVYMPSSEDLTCGTSGTPTDRYTALYNNWSQWVNGNLVYSFFTDVEPTLNRQGTFFRFLSFVKPNHYTVGKTNPFNTPKLQQAGAGENVDLIVPDNGCWLGHVEFISRGVTNAVNPDDYIGSNVLPGNGYCDVLDLVLDAPYYIDPNYFNADPTNRLMARWDGTIVPIESVAIAWWRDPTQRSISFASFGNIYVSPNYTRDTANGSNSTLPSEGTHGTQCAALAFGRTQGWAYNANKWVMNLFGDNNVGSLGTGLDVQKIFHIHKPVNPIYNSKDPTLSSNSWGIRGNKSGDGYYYWRTDSPVSYTRYTEPAFIDVLGSQSDGGRWKSELHDNSITQAGDELTQAGVICIVSAGNSGQQLVNPDHPNYDNGISYNTTTPLYSRNFPEGSGFSSIGTTNRRGWPGHMGKTESQTFQGNTTVKFPVIQVGALESNTGSNEEKIADYSDRGPAIDLFSSGAGAMAATVDTYSASSVPTIQRVDGVYSALSAGAMDLSQIGGCRDTEFTGTSAACPVAAGFLASVMQYNRDWTYENLRTWIETNVTPQSTSTLYYGFEATTPTDVRWNNEYSSSGSFVSYSVTSLQGAPGRVLYNASIPVSTAYGVQVGDLPPAPTPYSISGSLTINGLTFSLFDANLL